MSISHDDVESIIQLLEASQFDEMNLELDGLKLDLRRRGVHGPVSTPRATTDAQESLAPPTAHEAPHAVLSGPAPSDSGVVDIKAPMLGTLFHAPKPGADRFVTVGSRVEPDTVIGIVEVMKLMHSVSAGVRGEIVEIVASDAQLVEFDQVLVRVRVS